MIILGLGGWVGMNKWTLIIDSNPQNKSHQARKDNKILKHKKHFRKNSIKELQKKRTLVISDW